MELRLNDYQLPEKISFNFEELKQELTEKVQHYETLVYTDEQIKEAKADRSNLNKLKKSLNDERIRMEREYMAPFDEFKAKINEIIGIVDKPVALIDKQIKEYEDKQKQDKLVQIKELWNNTEHPDTLVFDKVFDSKMLNTSYTMKHVNQVFVDAIDRFNRDMDTLAALPEFGYEAQQEYIRTFDMNKALAEGQRMAQIQKQKAEREAQQAKEAEEKEKKAAAEAAADKAGEAVFDNAPDISAQIPVVPEKQWISFAALLSTEDALALKEFFDSRNIEFKPV